MGLDQYAYARKSGEEEGTKIFQWRKHPNLHGWIERLWRERENKGEFYSDTLMDHPQGNFNYEDFELTSEDLDNLERDIKAHALPVTTGFFFGQSIESDDSETLKFIEKARTHINNGEKIIYSSSW